MKPALNLYLDWVCTAVVQEEAVDWQWAILLRPRDGADRDRQALIVNKSRKETHAPIEIIGGTFRSISMSAQDTTLHFLMPNGYRQSVGLNPTQYAIGDTAHGGEVYPQWPEELEEAGIPSHPDEEVSSPSSVDWDRQRKFLEDEQHERHTREANEWIEEERNASGD